MRKASAIAIKYHETMAIGGDASIAILFLPAPCAKVPQPSWGVGMKRLAFAILFVLAAAPAYAVDCQYRSTTPSLGDQDLIILQCDSNGRLLQSAAAPSSTSVAGLVPVPSTAAESNHVFKASAGNLYAYQVTTGAVAGYVMLFNATSAPADGAVTPVKCVYVPATSTVGVSNMPPEYFSTGITVVFSSTGCFTKTASATAMFSGDVK